MADNHTLDKLQADYSINHERETQVMTALCTEYVARGFDRPTFEDINPDEQNGISFTGGVRVKPDMFFYANDKTFTYEIKFNNHDRFHDFDGVESVFIKCGAVISMIKDTYAYPNGHAIIATSRQFAILTARRVGSYQIEPIDFYGGKKCFVIPVADLEWVPWMAPIPPVKYRGWQRV